MTDTLEVAPVETSEEADAGCRGLLVIAPRVVERIAARVANEVDGIAPPGSASRPVRAEAELQGPTATIALRLGVTYPRPVGRVAAEVRGRVVDRVRELTGVTVDGLRITVDELPAARERARPPAWPDRSGRR